MKWVKKKKHIKMLTMIAFLLSLGSITWIVYGNDEKDITYNIQEEMIEEGTISNVTVELTPSSRILEIRSVTLPDKSVIEKQDTIHYEVKENGEYQFIVHYAILEENENSEVEEIEKEEIINYQVTSIIDKSASIKDETKGAEETVDTGAESNAISTYAVGDIEINETNFPDENFRNYLLSDTSLEGINGYGKDGILTVPEVEYITFIDVSKLNIKSLMGLRYFYNLRILYCADNQLTELDVSNNLDLKWLQCNNNLLKELDLTKNSSLQRLSCFENQITTLDISKNPINDYFGTSGQKIEIPMIYVNGIYKSNPNIKYILGTINNSNISYNSSLGQFTTTSAADNSTTFTTPCIDRNGIEREVSGTLNFIYEDIVIDETNFPDPNFKNYLLTNKSSDQIKGYGTDGVLTAKELEDITKIQVSNKNITSLKGIEKFNNLEVLNVSNNQLTSLSIISNSAITSLNVDNNQLSRLDLDYNKKLSFLSCGTNNLENLDLTYNTALTDLWCYNNQLTELNVRNNVDLTVIHCDTNQLTTLDLSNNQKLSTVISDKQTRGIKMKCVDGIWKSNENIKGITSINNSNIAYDSTTGILTTLNTNTKSATFSTNCIDGTGTTYSLSGTLNFTYEDIAIDETNFPDANFRNWLLDSKNINGYGADKKLTASELKNITSIDVNNKSISNLKGIEYFTSLTNLLCNNNQLTSLDVSKNTALTALFCYDNQLTSLDVSKNTALTALFCYDNQIASLDVSKNTALTNLRCHNNPIKKLDVSKNKELAILYCINNQLTELDVTQNVNLTSLQCYNNQLKSLDVTKNTKLATLYCNDNQLTELDVTKNTVLNALRCHNNQILNLDFSNQKKLSKDTNSLFMINNQKITIPMTLQNGSWQSNPDIKYQIGKVGNSNITYNSTTGQFSTANKNIATSTFSTDCVDGNGETRTMSGTLTFTYESIAIDEVNFPDENFRDYILTNTDTDQIKGYGQDKVLTTEEIANITAINVNSKGIKNLKGIEHFTAVLNLQCVGNQLTALDISQNTKLAYLYCYRNQIESLDVTKNIALVYLQCYSNKLTALNVTKNTALAQLLCGYNPLTALDVSKNTALTRLECNNSQLLTLDLTSNTKLTTIQLGNQTREVKMDFSDGIWKSTDSYVLGSIAQSNIAYDSATGTFTSNNTLTNTSAFTTECVDGSNTARTLSGILTFVYKDIEINETNFPDAKFRSWLIDSNNISGYGADKKLSGSELSGIKLIDVNTKGISNLKGIEYFTSLTDLHCYGNQITELKVGNLASLRNLRCNGNPLKKLDVSKNKGLRTLYCIDNQLTELDVTQNVNLVGLQCYNNQLKTLDVSKNTKLESLYCNNNQLTVLDLTNNPSLIQLRCHSNQIQKLDLSNQKNLSKDTTSTFIINNQRIEVPMKLSKGVWQSNPEVAYSISRVDNANITYNSTTGQFSSTSKIASSTFATDCTDGNGETRTLSGTLTFVTDSIEIDEVNFPDESFRNYLLTNTDTNQIKGYGQDKVLTAKEITDITEITVSSLGIKSLQGIEHFTEITKLLCLKNQITQLDITNNTKLVYLYCYNNQIEHLDVSKNTALAYLHCYGNKLTALDVTKNPSLSQLLCFYNQLSSLDVSKNTALYRLEANNNQLLTLDLSKNAKLSVVNLANQAKTIEMSYIQGVWTSDTSKKYTLGSVENSKITYNSALGQLTSADRNAATSGFTTDCTDQKNNVYTLSGTLTFDYQNIHIDTYSFPDENFRNYVLTNTDSGQMKGYGQDSILTVEEINDIAAIDVNSKGIKSLKGIEHFTELTNLQCLGNQLTELDISKNTKLTLLYCYRNQLTQLDVSKNTALIYLFCTSNKLTALDTSKNTVLAQLLCHYNQLTELDISKNTALSRLEANNNHLLNIDLSKNAKLSIVKLDNQTRDIEMAYADGNWKSDSNTKYTIGNIEESNIVYESTAGMFTSSNAITKSSVFTTSCTDGKGTVSSVSGTLHFTYDGFVSVSNIKDIPNSIQVGETLSLTGTVEPSNATEKKISWSIKDAGTTGAALTNGNLTVQTSGTVVLTATIAGGLEKGDYTKDVSIVTTLGPATLVSIPTDIKLERVKNDAMFEAVKEEEVKILPTVDTNLYTENFYVRTDPSFHLLNTTDSDEWFTAQIYDASNSKYTSKDTPLATLNALANSQKFYVKVFKDMIRKSGFYEGTMNFIIEYGEEK